MTILVTGAGLIGSYVSRKLIKMRKNVVLYDSAPRIDCISDVLDLNKIRLVKGNILNFPQLLEVIKKEKIDRIIHTAAMLNIPNRVDSPYMGIKVNIEGTLNILEIARILDIERVVLSSSAVIYFGATLAKESTYKEDFPLMTLSGRPMSIYATTKLSGEFLGLNYRDTYGVDFVAVRYAAAFGPWRCPHAPQITLMNELIEKPLQGKPAIIKETQTWSGHQEFVYIKDAAQGTILACYAKNLKTRIYNIGMGKTTTFQEIINIIKKLLPEAKIKVQGISKGIFGLPYVAESKILDIRKAQKELNYSPEYDMENGIRDYISWMKSRIKKL
jgi:UDP-glucose 4-epimerase